MLVDVLFMFAPGGGAVEAEEQLLVMLVDVLFMFAPGGGSVEAGYVG